MGKNRMEAFSDGVIAIALTIMVLELRPPAEATLGALSEVLPHLAGYALSFLYIAIYWNNHHHLIHTVRKVTAGMLWANNHLLFWLTLVPFVTALAGKFHLASLPLGVGWKGWVSLASYALSIPLAFVVPALSVVLFVFVALMWLVPERSLEKHLESGKEH